MENALVGELLFDIQSRRAQNTLMVVVALHIDDSLEIALKKLSGHKILSAPIKLGEGRYGILDVLDILNAIVDRDPHVALKEPAAKYCSKLKIHC
jgi:hypothetical protein